MKNEYFRFNWVHVHGRELVCQDTAHYFTMDGLNISEMKEQVRDSLKNPAAIINIHVISPITREAYELETGHIAAV